MALPRSKYVKEGKEGVYHCFSRCVRRAFLCGYDTLTQRDFSHRKTWLVDRLRQLAAIFAIEVCAYAVMENHYHTILRTRPDIVPTWSDWDVAIRWLCPIQSDSQRRGILRMTATDYFDLVDTSGRILRSDKHAAIDADLAPILLRIGANPEAWIDTVSRFGAKFRLAAGLVSSLRSFADQLGRRWLTGVAAARAAFAVSPSQSA